MSRAGEQAFAALSQYFLNRLAARSDAQFRTQAAAEEDARRKTLWREEQVAAGEDRKLVRRMDGGQAMDMDVGRYFDPKTDKFEERIYGAAPVAGASPNKSDVNRIEYADGRQGEWAVGQPLPEGAKFLVGGRKPQGGAPKEPKRTWIERDGEPMRVAENEIQKGDRPLDNTQGGRERDQGRRNVDRLLTSVDEGFRSVVNAGVSAVTGRPVAPASARSAAAAGPQLAPDAAATLQNAANRIAENPSARAAIEAQLKAAGYEELIALLPKG